MVMSQKPFAASASAVRDTCSMQGLKEQNLMEDEEEEEE